MNIKNNVNDKEERINGFLNIYHMMLNNIWTYNDVEYQSMFDDLIEKIDQFIFEVPQDVKLLFITLKNTLNYVRSINNVL